MIHDATVEVTCDGCSQAITISPEYVYTSYSGKGGHYDTSDDAIVEKLTQEGWKEMDGKHLCDDCKDSNEAE